jgi:hypothetical protein
MTFQMRNTAKGGVRTGLKFINKLSTDVEIIWITGSGERVSYGSVIVGGERGQHTIEGHVWLIAFKTGEPIAVFEVDPAIKTVIIDGPSIGAPGPKSVSTASQSASPHLSSLLASGSHWITEVFSFPSGTDRSDKSQQVAKIRDDLLAEGKANPGANLEAYRAGYALCNALFSVAEERKNANDVKFWDARSQALRPHVEDLLTRFKAAQNKSLSKKGTESPPRAL